MMTIFPMHIWALAIGWLLDLIIGDPEWFYHPVRLIGSWISFMEAILRAHIKNLRVAAVLLTVSTVLLSMAATWLVVWLLGLLGYWPQLVGMSLICWTCIATKNLADEAMGVAKALRQGIAAGRKRVARIVGRDTQQLDERGVINATIETVAENLTDGVIAPMLYLAIGGPILGMGFKAASTLDSMVGYKNEKYIDLGWCSARFDDLLNYIPARLAAVLMWISAMLLRLNWRSAIAITLRDHANHLSPNCAWTESAAAGALSIRLGGAHDYFGRRVIKPTIGDDIRPPEIADIGKVNRLLYLTSVLMLIIILLMARSS